MAPTFSAGREQFRHGVLTAPLVEAKLCPSVGKHKHHQLQENSLPIHKVEASVNMVKTEIWEDS